MKKLISIKSDENGENIYFTHKNGVDSVRKDDVIDVELLNPKSFKMSYSDISKKLIIVYFALIFFTIVSFGAPQYPKDVLMIYFGVMFWSFIFITYILTPPFTSRINTRNILKVYAKSNVLKYEIVDDEQYKELYFQFKKLLKKYFPKEGELILFKDNPKLKKNHNVLKILNLIFIGLLLSLLIVNGSLVTSWQYISILVISVIMAFYHYQSYNYLKVYVRYYLQNNLFKVVCKYRDYDESQVEELISENILYRNGYLIAIIPRDSNPNQKIKDYRNLNGGNHHQLIFAEEYRDITPILVEYFNDLSAEQNKSLLD